MFGPRMHAPCFQTVPLLEDGAGDDQFPLRANLQQQTPLTIAVTNAVPAKYAFLGNCALAHFGIKVTKDYHVIRSVILYFNSCFVICFVVNRGLFETNNC